MMYALRMEVETSLEFGFGESTQKYHCSVDDLKFILFRILKFIILKKD